MRISATGFVSLTMLAAAWTLPQTVSGDGPKDNDPSLVRQVPRPGIEVPDTDRETLGLGLAKLAAQIETLSNSKDARVRQLLPDVQIFHRAVEVALKHDEFFASNDIQLAKQQLALGMERAEQLAQGKAPWTTATGLVVRGFVSRIDGSVQPYGLLVPETYQFEGPMQHRLDIWFHGRGETVNEVKFIDQRMRQVGQYAPAHTFVLHPYGRYSNAFKFAGEVDVLEALDAVKAAYRIDDDRISVRGFSMGGAGCWQFAVHYADRWFAANPGAGFSETFEFLKFFQGETLQPTWYERKLWHLYDCPDYAANLFQCPTVAYSGEIDRQKQAADIMEEAMANVGLDLVHIIGPNTGHKIHIDSKAIIESKMHALAKVGRRQAPTQVRLVTYTLKYNRMHWLTINGMDQHWKKGEVRARIDPSGRILIAAENVTDLSLNFEPGTLPDVIGERVRLFVAPATQITGSPPREQLPQAVANLPQLRSDRSWTVRLRNVDGTWRVDDSQIEGLAKRHNLQGPIDDAFMDSFVFVTPSGKARHEQADTWSRSELAHAVKHWRQQFRGDACVKEDMAIDDADIANSNLVLFGDPQSNAVLAKIAARLPIQWTADTIAVGEEKYDARQHALIMIYPNPLNPKRYVVLNSGFTYREYAYLNNARQVPMLPDWAVIDLREPPGTQYPGKVANAGFFDERWQLKPSE